MIAGLGNPGNQHTGNRHNVGFQCLNRLAKRHGITFKAGRNSWTGSGEIEGARVTLVKPKTFVNLSGNAVAPLAKRDGLKPSAVIVVFDELDLPEGRIRLRQKGSDGGHNGLKSITSALGSNEYGRVRVGIGRPHAGGKPSWDPDVVADWVLSDPGSAGRKVIEEAVEHACDAVEAIIRDGWDRAMGDFNTAG